MKTSDFDYDPPESSIAQTPAEPVEYNISRGKYG